jgi:hypothetical protein
MTMMSAILLWRFAVTLISRPGEDRGARTALPCYRTVVVVPVPGTNSTALGIFSYGPQHEARKHALLN